MHDCQHDSRATSHRRPSTQILYYTGFGWFRVLVTTHQLKQFECREPRVVHLIKIYFAFLDRGRILNLVILLAST